MGLINLSESETTSFTQESDKLIENTIDKNIEITKTAISPTRYNTIYEGLLKYLSGSKITVTYYRQKINYFTKQTHDIQFSLERNDIELAFDKIHNLEIILSSALDINYNDDTGEMDVNGEGVIYPHIDVNIGDIFLYRLQDNLIGVFIINNIERLSISKGTAYKINFHLYQYITQELLDKLEKNIVDEYFFDKSKYIKDDSGILIKTDYNLYRNIKKKESNLLYYYISEYYNREYKTFLNQYKINDDIIINYYDNWIIEFLFNIIDFSNLTRFKISINNYLSNFIDLYFYNSIFYNILHRIYNKACKLFKYGKITNITYSGLSSSVTSLVHQNVILLTHLNNNDNIKKYYGNYFNIIDDIDFFYYVFSKDFYDLLYYNNDINNIVNSLEYNQLKPIEKITLKIIYNSDYFLIKDDILDFIQSWDPINNDDEYQDDLEKDYYNFYYIPIYLHYLKISKRIIR